MSLPEAEGKAVAAPAPDIPVRPSPFPAPRPRPKGRAYRRAGGVRAQAGGACAEAELGQATHHRLHREKVVRPRCAVRLAAVHTGRASWSMACSSLGQQALPNPLTPTLELPPRVQTAQTAPPGLRLRLKRDLVQTDNRLPDSQHCTSLILTLLRGRILEESIGAKKAS